jgi:hypothetical protein
MYKGRITGEYRSDEVTQEVIMCAITGASMVEEDQAGDGNAWEGMGQ